jgi:tRNA-Thr(GGU) m(6)t(6)A37 methyltransferase TsaA
MSAAEIRPGERRTDPPPRGDAEIHFLGLIHTPWAERGDCPKQGALSGPVCRVEVDPRWAEALEGLEAGAHLQLLYWMHLARRDLTQQRPRSSGRLLGTFALRSPMRPNPIASSTVRLEGREGTTLLVRGLDCVSGTPLVDIKPERCPAIGSPPDDGA